MNKEVQLSSPKIFLVLPAYNPGPVVIDVVREALPYTDLVILVDDGCSAQEKNYLQSCCHDSRVICLSHEYNQGKGHALFTGMRWCLDHMLPQDFILCMDSDGQHRAADIERFRRLAARNPDLQLALGQRMASGDMPWKSRLGNDITRALFRAQYGSKVHDTQTGFRMLSKAFAEQCLTRVKPGRYETEMNMLILAARNLPEIHSVSIPAIYFAGNKNTKFKPVRDSLSVMQLFIKYAAVSLASFGVDYLLFVVFLFWPGLPYLWANVSARVISATFNFLAHKEYSFGAAGRLYTRAMKYVGAVLLSLLLSSLLLYIAVDRLHASEYLAKPVVDVIVFVLNFLVLSRIVFAETKRKA